MKLKIGSKLLARVPIMEYKYQGKLATSELFCGDGRYVRITNIILTMFEITYRDKNIYLDKDIIKFAFYTESQVRKKKLDEIESR